MRECWHFLQVKYLFRVGVRESVFWKEEIEEEKILGWETAHIHTHTHTHTQKAQNQEGIRYIWGEQPSGEWSIKWVHVCSHMWQCVSWDIAKHFGVFAGGWKERRF